MIGDLLSLAWFTLFVGQTALGLRRRSEVHKRPMMSRKRLHAATIVGGLLVIIVNPLLMAWLVGVSQRHGFVDALACVASGCS